MNEYIPAEARRVASAEFPQHAGALLELLETLSFDLITESTSGVVMRDAKDQPILDAAIAASVDIVVTGDKDFHALDLAAPLILTPRQYLDCRSSP